MTFSGADRAPISLLRSSPIPVRLMAGPDVPVQRSALGQAQDLAALAAPAAQLGAELRELLLTPDVHAGPGVPVGSVLDVAGGVLPAMIGADIGCGMHLLTLDVPAEALEEHAAPLSRRLREIFFAGRRQVTLDADDRRAVLADGLLGLLERRPQRHGGLWELYDPATQTEGADRTHQLGSLDGGSTWPGFVRWADAGRAGARDGHVGSLGGGNHFAEIGAVAAVHDRAQAHAWSLRAGRATVMVHTGSLGFGAAVAAHFRAQALQLGLVAGPRRTPVLALEGPHRHLAVAFLRAMAQAANFAHVNRVTLGLMVVRAIADVLGEPPAFTVVGDAPHNLIWAPEGGVVRHRKGATPAVGPGGAGAHAFSGEPVLIPGSMGDRSFVLAGTGCDEALCSASHGAGRALARGAAARREDRAFEQLTVVTPVDPRALMAEGRADLLDVMRARLREEAPGAYKPARPVVDSVVAAGAARPVAELRPILTVKG